MRRNYPHRLFLATCLCLLTLLGGKNANAVTPVVADISTYRIAIDSDFTGIRIFIFGARNDTGDILVVIRGPEKNFIVRKKERLAGIWVNRKQLKFREVPDFFAVAALKPLEELNAPRLLRNLGIDKQSLLKSPTDIHDKARFPEFSAAFFQFKEQKRLYKNDIPLSFMGETLFKTVIPFPDTIKRGNYTAEIYLISNCELSGMHTMPIIVEKTGFDAMIYDMAHNYAAFYGLIAIAIALGAGWGAAQIFQRT